MAISNWLCHIRRPFYFGLLSLLFGSLMSCQSSPSVGNGALPPSSPNPSEKPSVPKAPLVSSKPQPITVSFKIDSLLEDLKVKQGEFIRKGQIIADLSQKRLDLETQKRTLNSELEGISQTGTVRFSTQVEEENIASAQVQVNTAQSLLQEYENNSPWTDFARDTLPLAEEEVELTRLTKNLKLAQKNLERANAKLAKKQAAIDNFQDQQGSSQARIQQALLAVEQKIAALKPVQASHTGTISKIDVSKTASTSQSLKVTLTLIPGDAPPSIPAPSGLPTGLPNETGLSDEKPSPSGSASDLLPPSLEIPRPDPSTFTPLPNSVGE